MEMKVALTSERFKAAVSSVTDRLSISASNGIIGASASSEGVSGSFTNSMGGSLDIKVWSWHADKQPEEASGSISFGLGKHGGVTVADDGLYVNLGVGMSLPPWAPAVSFSPESSPSGSTSVPVASAPADNTHVAARRQSQPRQSAQSTIRSRP